MIYWLRKAMARSKVRLAIEDVLDSGLPRAYTTECYQQKCGNFFEHVFERYPDRDSGVYGQAGQVQ